MTRPTEQCRARARPGAVASARRVHPGSREHRRRPGSPSAGPLPPAPGVVPDRSRASEGRRVSRGRCSSAAAGGRGARWGLPERTARAGPRPEPSDSAPGARRAWCPWGCVRVPAERNPATRLNPATRSARREMPSWAVAAGSCHRRSWRAEGRVRASGRAGWNRMPGPAAGWASASESAGWARARSGGPAGRARASTAGVRRAAVRAGRAEAPGSESSAQGAREACPVRRPCNRRVAAIRRRISGTWTRRHERPDDRGTQETGQLACPLAAAPPGPLPRCQTPRSDTSFGGRHRFRRPSSSA